MVRYFLWRWRLTCDLGSCEVTICDLNQVFFWVPDTCRRFGGLGNKDGVACTMSPKNRIEKVGYVFMWTLQIEERPHVRFPLWHGPFWEVLSTVDSVVRIDLSFSFFFFCVIIFRANALQIPLMHASKSPIGGLARLLFDG